MSMYEDVYWQVQSVLDESLGTEEEDGAGGGMAGDVAKLAEQRDAARAEVDRLHSWAGLVELLDEHWPADLFPGPSDATEPRPDDGPRVLALIRALDKVGSSRQAWAEEALREREQYRDLLGDIWLYVGWRYVTKQLTTEQKNLWADAVDAFGETGEDGPKADRWWLDGEPAPITVCACPTDEQLAKLGSGFTRPQCTVHPEGGRA